MITPKNKKLIYNILKQFFPHSISYDEIEILTGIRKDNISKYVIHDWISQNIAEDDKWYDDKELIKYQNRIKASRKIPVFSYYTWSTKEGKKRQTKNKKIKLAFEALTLDDINNPVIINLEEVNQNEYN